MMTEVFWLREKIFAIMFDDNNDEHLVIMNIEENKVLFEDVYVTTMVLFG